MFLHPGLWDMRTWDRAVRAVRRRRLPRAPLRPARVRAVEPAHRRAVLARRRPAARCSTPRGRARGARRLLDGRGARDRRHADGPRPRVGARAGRARASAASSRLEEEDEWWEALERADRGGGRGRRPRARRGPAARDLGAARHRRRGRRADPPRSRSTTSTRSRWTRARPRSSTRRPPLRLDEIDVPTLVVAAEHDPPEMRRRATCSRAASSTRGS